MLDRTMRPGSDDTDSHPLRKVLGLGDLIWRSEGGVHQWTELRRQEQPS
jgi:hypothetical protein